MPKLLLESPTLYNPIQSFAELPAGAVQFTVILAPALTETWDTESLYALVGKEVGGTAAGETTERVKEVCFVVPPPVADTVIVYVPVGVDEDALTVSVVEQFTVHEPGAYEYVAPVGRPEVVKVMACADAPFNVCVAVMPLTVDCPGFTDLLPLLISEKSKLVGSWTCAGARTRPQSVLES